ncbi:MAG: glycoside hydrolase domain-containing protein, partial [Ignavibacteriales bacterium]
MHNPGAGNIYIKSVTLNGKPYNKTWIRHADIMKGGVLEFEMSRTPEKKWGTG